MKKRFETSENLTLVQPQLEGSRFELPDKIEPFALPNRFLEAYFYRKGREVYED